MWSGLRLTTKFLAQLRLISSSIMNADGLSWNEKLDVLAADSSAVLSRMDQFRNRFERHADRMESILNTMNEKLKRLEDAGAAIVGQRKGERGKHDSWAHLSEEAKTRERRAQPCRVQHTDS